MNESGTIPNSFIGSIITILSKLSAWLHCVGSSFAYFLPLFLVKAAQARHLGNRKRKADRAGLGAGARVTADGAHDVGFLLCYPLAVKLKL